MDAAIIGINPEDQKLAEGLILEGLGQELKEGTLYSHVVIIDSSFKYQDIKDINSVFQEHLTLKSTVYHFTSGIVGVELSGKAGLPYYNWYGFKDAPGENIIKETLKELTFFKKYFETGE